MVSWRVAFRVQGLRFMIEGIESRVKSSGFRKCCRWKVTENAETRVQNPSFRPLYPTSWKSRSCVNARSHPRSHTLNTNRYSLHQKSRTQRSTLYTQYPTPYNLDTRP